MTRTWINSRQAIRSSQPHLGEKRKRSQDILAQIKAGGNFEALAKEKLR
jgi:uncharacterized protein (DUF433 family)